MPVKNTFFYKNRTLNCAGKLLDLSAPKVMGIVNATPDSFYSGSRAAAVDQALQLAEQMLEDGADIIDIGGVSTRPGAKPVEINEERQRVIPVIEAIKKKFPESVLSIDTTSADIAKASVEAGASIVNDISGGALDEDFLKTVASLKVPYILMHMKGTPATMQHDPQYEDIVNEVMSYFIEKTEHLKQLGIRDVILDVGFGFGKTLQHNYQLLKGMDAFKIFGLPILAGVSRKSMICKLLKVDPEMALNGTTAVHMLALINGTDILRVHDVREAREAIGIAEYYKNTTVSF